MIVKNIEKNVYENWKLVITNDFYILVSFKLIIGISQKKVILYVLIFRKQIKRSQLLEEK